MGERIPLFEIDYDERELENVFESVTRGEYWAKGPFVTEFEDRLADYLGVEFAVTVNSGTSALVAALQACGVGSGDEVIVPSFTFIATANAVRLVGARPVFADIERETYGLDPEDVRERLSSNVAAVLPVHPYGRACQISELASITAGRDVVLIEDAAEAFGAETDGQQVGTVGDAAALSFCQNKVVTTGEGGAIVTDDPEVARNAELFRSHGRVSKDYFESAQTGEYVSVGGNTRMADINAALGCAQMEKVEELIERRQQVATRYTREFEDVPYVEPQREGTGRHVHQLYTITLADGIDQTRFVERLGEQGVDSKVYWNPPVHLTECYRSNRSKSVSHLPTTKEIASRVVSLPMHPNLTESDIKRVVTAVRGAIADETEHTATG